MAIKKYRISGLINETGSVEAEIMAISKKQAELKAFKDEGFKEIESIIQIQQNNYRRK